MNQFYIIIIYIINIQSEHFLKYEIIIKITIYYNYHIIYAYILNSIKYKIFLYFCLLNLYIILNLLQNCFQLFGLKFYERAVLKMVDDC